MPPPSNTRFFHGYSRGGGQSDGAATGGGAPAVGQAKRVERQPVAKVARAVRARVKTNGWASRRRMACSSKSAERIPRSGPPQNSRVRFQLTLMGHQNDEHQEEGNDIHDGQPFEP